MSPIRRLSRIALALVPIAAPVPASADDVLPDGPHIYVEGSAEIEVAPDRLELTVAIRSTHQEIKVAKADVERRSALLIEACRALGIEEGDLSSGPLGIQPSYRYDDGARVFEGTRVDRLVSVNLRDLSKYSELMRAAIDSEVNEIEDVGLYAAASDELEDRALSAALTDARQRAERLARSAGAKLGDVYSISEFQTRREDLWKLHSYRVTTTFANVRHGSELVEALGAEVSESFVPARLRARAQVFVVFELRP